MDEQPYKIAGPGGVQLAAVLHLPDQARGAGVVILHGMLSHKDSQKHVGIARGLCQRGLAAVRFDFQGRGESPGDLLQLTFSRQVLECLAAIDSMKERAQVDRFGLVGSSMGGAVAILASAQVPAHGLVSLAAVSRTDQLGERIVGPKGMSAWERRGRLRLDADPIGWSLVEDSRKVDVLGAAKRITCPWLILHGEHDEVVPVSDAMALHQESAAGARLEVVPQADHRFSRAEHLDLVTSRTVDFLAEALTSGGSS